MSDDSKPIYGQLQCPVEFYRYCTNEFEKNERQVSELRSSLSNKFEKNERQVSELRLSLNNFISRDEERKLMQARRDEERKLIKAHRRNFAKWVVGILLTVASLTLAFIK